MVLQRFNFYLVFSHLWFLKWFLMELAFAFLAHFFFCPVYFWSSWPMQKLEAVSH